LKGAEFEMTDGTHTRRCFISQQEIDKWAGHVGKIDQNIAFELFVKHAEEMCSAASRALDTLGDSLLHLFGIGRSCEGVVTAVSHHD
jgi:hypothetical protein